MNLKLLLNKLKTSIGGNVFALFGIIFPLMYSITYFVLKNDIETYTGAANALGFTYSFLALTQILVFFICVFIFLIEKAVNYRINKVDYTENKLYNYVFYIGVICNVFIISILSILFLYSSITLFL